MLEGDWKGVVFDRTNEHIVRFMGEKVQHVQRSQQSQRRTRPGAQSRQSRGKMAGKNGKGRQEMQPQVNDPKHSCFKFSDLKPTNFMPINRKRNNIDSGNLVPKMGQSWRKGPRYASLPTCKYRSLQCFLLFKH
jgi:hypothetical protein